MIPRLRRAWQALAPEQRLAAGCAMTLFITMFLPWYEKDVDALVKGKLVHRSDTLSAFQAFSFVEAAVLLVAAGVLAMLFARAEGRRFHLPGGDGTVIMAAGIWVCVLVFIRQVDKPSAGGGDQISATVGVHWGIFVAFIAGLALTYAGYRLRQAHLAEPALPGEAPTRRQARPPREERPQRQERPPRESRVQRGPVPDPHAASTEVAPRPPRQPRPHADRPVVDGGEQLSFDEQE
jgi:hypothetical protein